MFKLFFLLPEQWALLRMHKFVSGENERLQTPASWKMRPYIWLPFKGKVISQHIRLASFLASLLHCILLAFLSSFHIKWQTGKYCPDLIFAVSLVFICSIALKQKDLFHLYERLRSYCFSCLQCSRSVFAYGRNRTEMCVRCLYSFILCLRLSPLKNCPGGHYTWTALVDQTNYSSSVAATKPTSHMPKWGRLHH